MNKLEAIKLMTLRYEAYNSLYLRSSPEAWKRAAQELQEAIDLVKKYSK